MPKLDSNFGAPYHVVTWDGRIAGVYNSFLDGDEAQTNADSLKARLEADGVTHTDVYVVEGQAGLAQLIEDLEGTRVSAQTSLAADDVAPTEDELAASSTTTTSTSSKKSSK